MALFAFTNGKLNMNAFSNAAPGPATSQSQGGTQIRMSMSGDPNRKKNNLVPVTLMSVLNCQPAHNGEGGYVSINKTNVNKVCVVAQILRKERKTTAFELDLDDSTGQVTCVFYISGEEKEDRHILDILENKVSRLSYIKIVGTVRRKDDGSVSISGFAAFPIVDMNEVPYHLLESVHTGLEMLKTAGPMISSSSSQPTTASENITNMTASAVPTNPTMDSSGDVIMGAGAAQAPSMTRGFSSVSLMDFYQQKMKQGSDKGYTEVEFVKLGVNAGFASDAMKSKWAELVEECALYNTIDDDHFTLGEM